MEVWLVYERLQTERLNWFDWTDMATDTSDIRRRENGRDDTEGKEGGGKLGGKERGWVI